MAMKLKFVEQSYQTDAVNSVVDVFDGCEVKDSPFTIRKADDSFLIDELGYSNKCSLTDSQLLENLNKIQEKWNIKKIMKAAKRLKQKKKGGSYE